METSATHLGQERPTHPRHRGQTSTDDLYVLDSQVRSYAWGSTTFIANLQQRPASGSPEAELWIGAHEGAPSTALVDGRVTSLAELIAKDPIDSLGEAGAARFGSTLPFLLKVLAADQPLSLQTHPSKEWAVWRFAQETLSGISIDDPMRLYKDPNHKPELLCALTPFSALCGFQSITVSAAIFDALKTYSAESVSYWLTSGLPQNEIVKGLIEYLLGNEAEVAEIVLAARAYLERDHSNDADVVGPLERCVDLDDRYPGDSGAVISLLMNFVALQPGDTISVEAGVLHAYLQGSGIEIMASSDNVLRAGLTSKVVAVEELLAIADFGPRAPSVTRATAFEHMHTYESPSSDFELRAVHLTNNILTHEVEGPEIILCVAGYVSLLTETTAVQLSSGEAAFVMASAGRVAMSGHGEVFLATTGRIDGP
jgi:mannose-6-phosphate isomerase